MNRRWQAAAPAVHQGAVHQPLAVVVALEEVHQVLAAVRAVVLAAAAVHQPLALRAAMHQASGPAWRRRKPWLQHQPLAVVVALEVVHQVLAAVRAVVLAARRRGWEEPQQSISLRVVEPLGMGTL